MSQDHNSDGKLPPPDVDISRWAIPKLWIWILALIVMGAGLYYVLGWIKQNRDAGLRGWPEWTIAIILAFVVLLAWLGPLLSWRYLRIAQRPTLELHKGNMAEAERAYRKANAYAAKLKHSDPRKAAMLVEMATYLNDRGQRRESRALLDEALILLERHADKSLINYFIALNNHAVYLMAEHDYAEAQKVLERVIDILPTMKKKDMQSPEMDILLNVNVVFLFIKLGQPADAEPYMDEAVRLFDTLGHGSQKAMRDSVLSQRALWYCALGQFDDAEEDIEQAAGSEYGNLMWAQAKVHMARREFTQAEQILRKTVAQWDKIGSSHRPENLEVTLDLAECLFNQGRYEDAFASLKEARAIAADFKLPPDEAWRTALTRWVPRAKALERLELADGLERELAQMPSTGCQAITILEKLRIAKASTPVAHEPEA